MGKLTAFVGDGGITSVAQRDEKICMQEPQYNENTGDIVLLMDISKKRAEPQSELSINERGAKNDMKDVVLKKRWADKDCENLPIVLSREVSVDEDKNVYSDKVRKNSTLEADTESSTHQTESDITDGRSKYPWSDCSTSPESMQDLPENQKWDDAGFANDEVQDGYIARNPHVRAMMPEPGAFARQMSSPNYSTPGRFARVYSQQGRLCEGMCRKDTSKVLQSYDNRPSKYRPDEPILFVDTSRPKVNEQLTSEQNLPLGLRKAKSVMASDGSTNGAKQKDGRQPLFTKAKSLGFCRKVRSGPFPPERSLSNARSKAKQEALSNALSKRRSKRVSLVHQLSLDKDRTMSSKEDGTWLWTFSTTLSKYVAKIFGGGDEPEVWSKTGDGRRHSSPYAEQI